MKPLLSYQHRQRELVRVLMYLFYLLIHDCPGLCTPSPCSHVTERDVTCDVTERDPVTHYVTPCDIPSHAINRNRKENKRKRNINIDLAVVASQWFEVTTYNTNTLLYAALLSLQSAPPPCPPTPHHPTL